MYTEVVIQYLSFFMRSPSFPVTYHGDSVCIAQTLLVRFAVRGLVADLFYKPTTNCTTNPRHILPVEVEFLVTIFRHPSEPFAVRPSHTHASG